MSNGKRSWEFSAIPITLVVLGITAVILWAANAGLWVWIAVGIVVLAVFVVLTVMYMRRPHHPAPPPPTPAHVDDDVHRILVIADDDCAPAELGAALAGAGGPRAVFVVAPALGSRTARWTSDDRAYQDAQRHLEATLQALAGLNVEAKGHVGSHDPLQAADDGLREFPADEIVFAVNPAGTNWLEDGVIDAARERYSVPVRELVVAGS